MTQIRSAWLVVPALLIAILIVGCGTSNDSLQAEAPSIAGGGDFASNEFFSDSAAATAAPAATYGGDDFGPAGAPGAPGAPGEPGSSGQSTSGGNSAGDTVAGNLDGQVQAIASLDRIIVRTVEMTLVVQNVTQAMSDITELANSSGGWVVGSTRNGNHTAFISFRVPAAGLDIALDEVRTNAVEVKSESSSSQDVTDEFTDLEARLRSQTASEDALITLLGQAQTVEDTLKVQTELARIREDLESMGGRLNLLTQTSAFSLVNVFLNAEPTEIQVNAGSDIAVAVGQPVTFTATLQPPEDIENFEIRWDFGDGFEQGTSRRTAATLIEGQRITSAVTHVYQTEDNSPYVVTIDITGGGDSGVVEGTDTLIATVSDIPVLDVFAGQSVTVEAGTQVGFAGTFTRPEGLDGLKYRWEFGDGSPAVEGVLAADVTVAEATHTYPNNRPIPYTATLVISGDSKIGEIEGTSALSVRVNEAESWVIADWSIGDTFKDGVQALSAVGVYGVRGLVWALVLSPVWVLLLVVLGIGRWQWQRRRTAGA